MPIGRNKAKTPCKHKLLTQVARIFSIKNNGEILGLDLCSGNGKRDIDSGTSSAIIMLNYCKTGVFFEKDLHSAQKLLQTVNKKQESNKKLINKDFVGLVYPGCSEEGAPLVLDKLKDYEGVLVNADPNSVKDLSMTKRLLDRLPSKSVIVMTLGFTPSKRCYSNLSDREEWFDYFDDLKKWLPMKTHDIILYRLCGDISQFVYLVAAQKHIISNINSSETINSIFSTWHSLGKDVDVVQYGLDPEGFDALCNELVHTREELANAQ